MADRIAPRVSIPSILAAFSAEPCLELRQIAATHGVAIDCQELSSTLSVLEKDGRLCRLGGKGHRTVFIRSSFED